MKIWAAVFKLQTVFKIQKYESGSRS